ncbi:MULTISPECIES: hypothetical protein [unclassified Arthrobacter]|uniref:hypothetical protein n=1 Tax=unclassified Arthrobacter TaxID=235627 RepID=UPI003399478E
MADSRQGSLDPSPSGAGMPVSRLPEKGRVVCHGYIESVTYMPADQSPAFTATLTDADVPSSGSGPVHGSGGRLRVVWLGRRRVQGIDAGTEVRVEGMVTQSHGLPTIFNPRYEILSSQEHE